MQVVLLYAIIVLIWGSTWGAIPFQFGVVAEEVSVAYRFAIGAAALYLYAILAGKNIRLSLRHYPMVIVQGFLLFSLNYFFDYCGNELDAETDAYHLKPFVQASPIDPEIGYL